MRAFFLLSSFLPSGPGEFNTFLFRLETSQAAPAPEGSPSLNSIYLRLC